jgi:hypothetical protein
VQRLWKGLATIAVLSLLYLRGSPVSEYSLPKIPWTIIFIVTLTFGISLVFGPEVAPPRRFALAYLILSGVMYLVAAVLGLFPNWGLIEASLWHSVISPYLLISFLEQFARHFPYGVSRAPYEVVPQSEHSFYSVLVIVIGLTAILAAFGMAANKKAASRAWLVLIGLLSLAFVGHVIVGFASWGMANAVVPLCWEASYVSAFLMARRGMHPPCPKT